MFQILLNDRCRYFNKLSKSSAAEIREAEVRFKAGTPANHRPCAARRSHSEQMGVADAVVQNSLPDIFMHLLHESSVDECFT